MTGGSGIAWLSGIGGTGGISSVTGESTASGSGVRGDVPVEAEAAAAAFAFAFAVASISLRLRSAAFCRASRAWLSRIDLVYASRMCSRRCSKSIGPTDIFRRRGDGSAILDGGKEGGAGDLALSTALIRELAVVATETGCRGRELLRGGESFGGGAIILAWSRLLLVGVTRDRGAAFRVTPPGVGVLALEVGVFARLVGVPALDIRPLTVGGLLKVEGELERVDEGVVSLGLLSFLTERGSLDVDPPPAAVLEAVPFREGVLREGVGAD